MKNKLFYLRYMDYFENYWGYTYYKDIYAANKYQIRNCVKEYLIYEIKITFIGEMIYDYRIENISNGKYIANYRCITDSMLSVINKVCNSYYCTRDCISIMAN